MNVTVADGPVAGAAPAGHRLVDQIVFTGSAETGRSILHTAATRVIPTVMELGDLPAAIVFDDADLEGTRSSPRQRGCRDRPDRPEGASERPTFPVLGGCQVKKYPSSPG